MLYVLTADQRHSRRSPDRVPEALDRLGARPVLRSFRRTAGDEFQGVLADPAVVVDTCLDLVRDGSWSIGIGIGPVELPLPADTRAGRGEAFVQARAAVEAAKRRPQRLAVRGVDQDGAGDAEAVLTLLAVLVQHRSDAAWKAVELIAEGLSHAAAAHRLGVSRQAVGQRLTAGLWQQEQDARPVAVRLLARACEAAG